MRQSQEVMTVDRRQEIVRQLDTLNLIHDSSTITACVRKLKSKFKTQSEI